MLEGPEDDAEEEEEDAEEDEGGAAAAAAATAADEVEEETTAAAAAVSVPSPPAAASITPPPPWSHSQNEPSMSSDDKGPLLSRSCCSRETFAAASEIAVGEMAPSGNEAAAAAAAGAAAAARGDEEEEELPSATSTEAEDPKMWSIFSPFVCRYRALNSCACTRHGIRPDTFTPSSCSSRTLRGLLVISRTDRPRVPTGSSRRTMYSRQSSGRPRARLASTVSSPFISCRAYAAILFARPMPAPFLLQVDDDARALRLDVRERELELLGAVALEGAQHLGGEARVVDSQGDVLEALGVARHDGGGLGVGFSSVDLLFEVEESFFWRGG